MLTEHRIEESQRRTYEKDENLPWTQSLTDLSMSDPSRDHQSLMEREDVAEEVINCPKDRFTVGNRTEDSRLG